MFIPYRTQENIKYLPSCHQTSNYYRSMMMSHSLEFFLTLTVITLAVQGAVSLQCRDEITVRGHIRKPSFHHHHHHRWMTKTKTLTELKALPSWTYYSLGHIIGGTTGTPIVIRATKSWYQRISLPSWTPPNFVFAPVWTTLYGLMGLSVSIIMKKSTIAPATCSSVAKVLWTIHYALNLMWAPIFFGGKYLRMGLWINYLLLSTLGLILYFFHQIDPLAAYLQIPYFLWLIYATKLNQSICKLNPTVDGVNAAMIQAELCEFGPGYNDAMLQYDIMMLQKAASKYAGL